jgi:sec-independent protein translocase protein TatA
MTAPLLANLGPTELILIVLVIVLLFGASKLPELARGSGRALRIFKAETKGLMDDDDDVSATPDAARTPSERSQAQLELESKQRDLAKRQAELDAEADRLSRGDTA